MWQVRLGISEGAPKERSKSQTVGCTHRQNTSSTLTLIYGRTHKPVKVAPSPTRIPAVAPAVDPGTVIDPAATPVLDDPAPTLSCRTIDVDATEDDTTSQEVLPCDASVVPGNGNEGVTG